MNINDSIYARQIMNIAKEILTPREYDVILSCCWGNASRVELSRDYNVGPERIRQIEAKALRKIRVKMNGMD